MSAKLLADRLKLAEHARQLHRVSPDEGTTFNEVLEPAYWVHVGSKLIVGDKVEIMPKDGAWYAEAVVVSCSRVHARIAPVVYKQFFEQKAPAKEGDSKEPLEVSFKGPQRKWSVIRTKDKTYVKEGFDTREDASAWMKANEADLLG